jgi:predicted nucleic-acid-binding Zn-ribbon protein
MEDQAQRIDMVDAISSPLTYTNRGCESMPNILEPETLKLVNRALEVLKEKVKHDKCPRCDVFDWSVDAIAIDTIPIQGVPAHMPLSYFPGRILILQIVCKNCGYTMFHNLNALGLAVPQER